jgi:hypothetical protein
MAVGVLAALTVFTEPAWAQSSQVTYSLAGVETAATSTEGTFVGVALARDDFGTWGAVIDHDPLANPAPLVTGGAFAINGQVRDLQGVITGGAITRLGGSCRKETFSVTGGVALVNGGSGVFGVTLTHYGFRMPGGGCVTFFATVEGLISLTLP